MTDYQELKRLAEAAPEGPWFGPEYAPGTSYVFDVDLGSLLHYESIDTEQDACLRYVAAANPAAVQALIADLHGYQQGAKAEADAGEEARAEVRRLKAEVEALRNSLLDASEELATWGAYASEYFQEKHDLAGCVARFHNAAMRKEAADGQAT